MLNPALLNRVSGTFLGSVQVVLYLFAHIKFSKHDYSKRQKKERESSVPVGHDVRALHQRKWSDQRVAKMLTLVKEYQESSGNVVGWSHILPQDPSVGTFTPTTEANVENTAVAMVRKMLLIVMS